MSTTVTDYPEVEAFMQGLLADPKVLAAGMPTREAYGRALLELGGANPDVVALCGDLGKSTRVELFALRFPERYVECGAAEQNMMSIAAGLASCGKIPFASTFAVFATGRAFDQIRVGIAQPGMNVKIVASHGGITVGEDGKSAQAIEDLSLMCALPGFTVVVPADAVETAQAVAAAARTPGPFYIRCGRPAFPIVHGADYRFVLGKATTLREGQDTTIIAIGVMVSAALEAASTMAQEGIQCRVLNMATLKPTDEEAILRAARETGAIVTAEDHLVHGGLGSIVAQTVAREHPVPMRFVAIKDVYGESGKPQELLEKYGLTAAAIAENVRAVLRLKK